MMSAGGAASEGAWRGSGRRPSSSSITASPPTRPALHHRRARCVRIADTRTEHCKATTVRPSVPLFQRDHGVQMSEMRQDGVFR